MLSMHWRIGARWGPLSGSSLRAGRRRSAPKRFGDGGFEVFAGVALVGDDDLAAAESERQQAQRDFAFFLIGGREDRGARGAVGGGQEVQAHTPEPAAVALAVAVAASVGELRPASCFERASAFDRCRVQQHDLVGVSRAIGGEHPDQPLDRVAQPVAALPIPGLVGQTGNQMRQSLTRDGEKLPVGIDTHDRLGNGERDDLRIGHAPLGVLGLIRQEIVSGAEHRSEQQVEVGEHRGLLWPAVIQSTADFDPAAPNPYPTTRPTVESTI